VKCRRVANETKRAAGLLGRSKRSEEKKQVPRPDRIASEMALCGSGLPEDRTPTRSTCNRLASQIGIEVRSLASAYPAARQVFDHLRD